jgi:uncharacterized membrane protein YeaQ/YmgE (transglycosylase-associated protein family)
MFPVDPSFVYVAYLLCAIIGLVLGLVSGVLVSMLLKLRIRRTAIAMDALLGATGSVIAASGLWRLGFQHPFIAAIISAVVLPGLHQLVLSKHVRVREERF